MVCGIADEADLTTRGAGVAGSHLLVHRVHPPIPANRRSRGRVTMSSRPRLTGGPLKMLSLAIPGPLASIVLRAGALEGQAGFVPHICVVLSWCRLGKTRQPGRGCASDRDRALFRSRPGGSIAPRCVSGCRSEPAGQGLCPACPVDRLSCPRSRPRRPRCVGRPRSPWQPRL